MIVHECLWVLHLFLQYELTSYYILQSCSQDHTLQVQDLSIQGKTLGLIKNVNCYNSLSYNFAIISNVIIHLSGKKKEHISSYIYKKQ